MRTNSSAVSVRLPFSVSLTATFDMPVAEAIAICLIPFSSTYDLIRSAITEFTPFICSEFLNSHCIVIQRLLTRKRKIENSVKNC